MAYIEPNSIVKVCYGIPFEPDYEHTVLFPSEGLQEFAISSSAKYTYTPTTYQRVNKQKIRVGTKADNLYECNYLMFQNTNFGNKWFYAFITAVEYINNECSEISYEIDVWQTYLFDFRIGDCFVEREHIASDTLGANYVPEGLELGEYVLNGSLQRTGILHELGIYILIANGTAVGKLIGNTFQGGDLYCFPIDTSNPSSTENAIRSFLSGYYQTPEEVVAIWTAPCHGISIQNNKVTSNEFPGGIIRDDPITITDTIDGYKPKNNKLYMYPYNCFMICNSNGQSMKLRYEYFKNFFPMLQIDSSIMPTPEAIARPIRYKHFNDEATIGGGNYPGALAQTISTNGWGNGSWSNNTWAQMVESTTLGGIGRVIGGTVGTALTGNPLPMLAGITTSFMGVFTSLIKKDVTPDTNYGTVSNGTAMAENNLLDFYYGRISVTAQVAQIVDEYFNMYGYQTNLVKVPEINSRPHWNYVKAHNCTILGGSMPATAIKTIKETLGNGITFWKSMSEVGEYGYDNSSP